MTTETSRNPTYAPFVQWSVQQAPVPQTVHNLPGSIAGNGSATTSLIRADGFTLISAGITATQAGTMSIQRYLDDGGTQIQGAVLSVPLTAGAAANLDVLDGKPFSSFTLTVTNNSASTMTISGFALLLQTTSANQIDTGADGSTTVMTGGTAQTLFGGAVPVNGFFVANPDAVNDLWVALGTTAAANGQGSIRIPASGYFSSEPGLKPWQAISVVGAVTGQKITAARW